MNANARIAAVLAFLLGSLLAGDAPVAADASSGGPEAALAAMARGDAALERGAFGEAAKSFSDAARRYAAADEPAAHTLALLRLAQAREGQGEYHEAARTLGVAKSIAEGSGNEAQLVAVLGALGNVQVALGPAEEAERTLTRAAELARKMGDPKLEAATLTNLGNCRTAMRDHARALDAYERGAELAEAGRSAALRAHALANAARSQLHLGDPPRAKTLADEALEQASGLPASHAKAYLLIHIARTLGRIGEAVPGERSRQRLRSYELLREAETVSRRIGDPRASSFALGYQGGLYEQESRFDDALGLTRRAAFQAQQADAPDSLYLWQWQAGRLWRELGEKARAIDSYTEAVNTIESLRHRLAVTYGSSGSSFEEALGPVYFELVDLLLRRAATLDDDDAVQELLLRSRHTVELLKKAELRDYFRDECVDALQETVRNPWDLSPTAAVIYPILLEDRLELLVTFGSAETRRYGVPVGRAEVTREVHRLRHYLEKRTTNEYRPHARKLYRWLIGPIGADLVGRSIDTLVFVPWGPLRTIPMAALHDGERFLIEKYAVAITPGIELTDPRPLDRERIQLFLSGLSVSVDGFPPLDHVPGELSSLQALHGGEILLDEGFRLRSVRDTLADEQFSVVHIATHGEISSEADQTYLLAYDGKLTMDRLSDYVGLFRFRDTPLELLTLSACDTAQGDERAALGLSGIAIKAGARSALATLWKVNDAAAAELVVYFYAQLLDPSVSRAQALQRAQSKLLGTLPYDHPGYWSAFLLISSWL